MRSLLLTRPRPQCSSISKPPKHIISYVTARCRLLTTLFYSMRAMSATNLSNVLERIGSMAPKLSNRLRRANALVETLSTFQAPLKRLRLEDNPPRSLMNRHDSDRLLDGLLDPSVSNEDDEPESASTGREANNDLSAAQSNSPNGLIVHQHHVGYAACVRDTVRPLPFPQSSSSSIQEQFPEPLEGILPDISTALPSPAFFRNAFYDPRSPVGDEHVNSTVSPTMEDSIQLGR
jgi:hypothetical protein